MKKTLLSLVGLCLLAAGLFAAFDPAAAFAQIQHPDVVPVIALGGMIINRATLADLTTGFKTIFQGAFDTAESDYLKVAMPVTSTSKQEVYPWLGKTTGFREWIGDRVLQNLATHDFTIKNKSFENTVTVDRDDIEDDSIGLYTPVVAQLGQDAKTHPDELVFSLIKNGFTGKCYDGQYFFDADHPVLGENGQVVSVSNYQAGANPAWFLLDTSKMVKPFIFQKRRDYQFVAMDSLTDEVVFNSKQFRYGVDCRVNAGYGMWQMAYASKAALDATNLNAAIAAMSEFKGDNGKPLNVKARLLVVPPVLRETALKLVKAETIEGTSNINRGVVEVLDTAWLA